MLESNTRLVVNDRAWKGTRHVLAPDVTLDSLVSKVLIFLDQRSQLNGYPAFV